MLKGKKLFFVLVLVDVCNCAYAQQTFRGSFLMSFAFSTKENMPPLLWNVDGNKIAIEIQDTMKRKGVTRRILFNALDSTWTMCMEFNDVKQGTRMRTKNMVGKEVSFKPSQLKKLNTTSSSGSYVADKMVFETKAAIDTLAITQQVNFDLPKHYALLSHCGLINISLRKGNWYNIKKSKGMVTYVKSVDGKSNNSYTVSITNIKPGNINPALFSTKGFKISDIPEGQSCGPMTKE